MVLAEVTHSLISVDTLIASLDQDLAGLNLCSVVGGVVIVLMDVVVINVSLSALGSL